MRSRAVAFALAKHRIAGFVALAALVSSPSACSSDTRGVSTPVKLSFVAPKGVLDEADAVKLDVWDGASCKGPDLVQGAATKVGDTHALARDKSCGDGTQWCSSFDVPQDAGKPLVWYVEGSVASKRTFRGCAQQAANQDALTVTIKIVKYIEGVICGDNLVGVTETCDEADGEACDATTCQTKEVVVSNGLASQLFYKGLPGRKQGVSLNWLPEDKLFAAWSDRATGPDGGDDSDQITWRRLTGQVVTDTAAAAALHRELRLQVTGSFSPTGNKLRSGISLTPAIAAIEATKLLVAFARTPPGDTSHVYGSIQATNMGAPPGADVALGGTTGTQSQPAVAASSTGDSVVVFVDGAAIKSVFRKSGGSFSAPQAVSTSGSNAAPRVAWAGSDYVVVWTDGDDIKVRRLGADGTAKGAEAVANAGRKAGKQDQPDVAGIASGEALVVWRSTGGEGDVGADIRAQRFDATGNPVGTEVSTALSDVNANGDQGTPVVASGALAGGTPFYLVAWTDPGRGQIAARYLASAGGFLDNNATATKSEFDVGLTSRALSSPAVAIGAGFCAVAFVDDSDGDAAADDDRVRIRRFPLPPPP